MTAVRHLRAGAWLVLAAAALAVAPCASPALAVQAPAPREWTRDLKIRLLEALPAPPQVVVLGSSRAMRLNPDHVRRLGGRTAFNCSVSSGGIPDAWAFLHLIRDRFPDHVPTYLWLVDLEQFRRASAHPYTLAEPRLARYLAEYVPAAPAPGSSAGVVRHRTVDLGDRAIFDAEGFCRWNRYDHWRRRGRTLKAGVRYSIRKFDAIYPGGFPSLRRLPKTLMRDSIRLLNEWGSRPVIVLTPYHPKLLKHISPRGHARRHAAVRRFVAALRRDGLRFRFFDFTRVAAFGGAPTAFYDGTHGDVRLMRRLTREVVRRCGGTL